MSCYSLVLFSMSQELNSFWEGWYAAVFSLPLPRLPSSWWPQPTLNSLRPSFLIPTMCCTVAF